MGLIRRHPGVIVVSTLLVVTLMVTASMTGQSGPTIRVSGTPWGPSTCFIGATDGNVRFDIDDLVEAGLTTYRIYGGMSRWEWEMMTASMASRRSKPSKRTPTSFIGRGGMPR